MQTSLSRPFRPIELGAGTLAFFSLPALAEDLQQQDEYARSGVAAVTLARDEHATLVLVALRKGAVMREHRAPSAATVVLLGGRVRFVDGDGAGTELEPGALATFSADLRHAVEALEDAVYLVIIGGRSRPAAAARRDSGAE
jgi:quercetin dioxygenase-like cupin family protein